MSTSTDIFVHDPVDAAALFRFAQAAVDSRKWYTSAHGPITMFHAEPGQGAAALVTVQFATNGGAFPDPDGVYGTGYALLSLATDHGPDDAIRALHARITNDVGSWLRVTKRAYSWQFEEDGWIRVEPDTKKVK